VASTRLSADAAPVVLLETEEDWTIVAANAALRTFAGLEPAAVVGRRLPELVTRGSRIFLETHCVPVLLARNEVQEVAVEVVAADRRLLPAHLHAHRDPATGRLHVALVSAFNRRTHEEELRRMRARERAEHDLQALTARLSEQALRGIELDALCAVAADGLVVLLQAGLVTVAEVGPDGEVAVRAARAARAPIARPVEPDAVAVDVGRALVRFARESVLLETGPPEGAGRVCAGPAGVASLSVPVGPPAQPWGVLTVHRPSPQRFSSFEIRAAHGMAGVLWTVVLRLRDVADAEHRALHDPLTGLANRHLLLDRLHHELVRARRDAGSAPAVLFLDLDDFKLVNDSLGHSAGDRLLQEIAARLTAAVREIDTVARLGGDEFVVLCPDIAGARDAERLADRVHEALAPPIDLGGHRQWVRGSVGVVLARPDATAEQVLGDADTAMYEAKAGAPGRHVVFDVGMRDRAEERLRTESELHEAIAGGQLRCHLQPIVRLADGSPVGLEALVRWEHPSRGLLEPAEFLPVAQQTGLIGRLGAEVLRLGCAALAELRAGIPAAAGLHLSVNVSPSQLATPEIVALVSETLREHGLDGHPGLLRLEVTESLLVDRVAETKLVLEWLRSLGVGVLIDDFGTGFSSLSRLRALPIDGLKIDRSFVAALGDDGEGDGALIRAVLQLGRALDLQVVCEGVETEAQRRRLQRLGAGLGQGHLFAPALDPADLAARLCALAGA
jgi:diguanylate cyclase (GGDEF)-like protein